jgi:histidinol-phosphate aminotransferase
VDFEKLAREEVLTVRPYVPGKPVEELQRERGLDSVCKLASNENPHSPDPAVIEAICRAASDLNRYPDDCVFYLYRALAEHLGVEQERLLIAAGSVEILYMMGTAFVKPEDTLVYATPSFVIYDIVSRISCGTGIAVPTDERFCHDLPAMAEAVDERTKIVFIANPNNPTGTYVTSEELETFLETVPENVLVAVDEAYYEYIDAPDFPQTLEWLDRFPNLIVLRTFSKLHSLAGIRIGYSISHPDVKGILERVRVPFNVNTIAQVAALASLGRMERQAPIVEANRAALDFVTKELTRLGCRVLPSQTNFVMAFLPINAAAAYEGLLDRGVIIRPLGSFGSDMDAVRITVGTPEENDRLIAGLEEMLAERAAGD